MLKRQDIVILLKILSTITQSNEYPNELLTQYKLAIFLCMSASEVNAGIKRLVFSQLLTPFDRKEIKLQPIKAACEECLISSVKYFIPSKLGAYTRGIATGYAAPIFEKHILMGNDPIPIWPYGEEDKRGLALEPLYRSVPESVSKYPDQLFYEFLFLIDAIRTGRARERNIAVKLLKEKIYNEQTSN